MRATKKPIYNDPKFLKMIRECLEKGMNIPDICEKLGVSQPTVSRGKKILKQNGYEI